MFYLTLVIIYSNPRLQGEVFEHLQLLSMYYGNVKHVWKKKNFSNTNKIYRNITKCNNCVQVPYLIKLCYRYTIWYIINTERILYYIHVYIFGSLQYICLYLPLPDTSSYTLIYNVFTIYSSYTTGHIIWFFLGGAHMI